jgi:hypothetical protein
MAFDALWRRARKAPAKTIDIHTPDRRTQHVDRRASADRRCSTTPNISGQSRRVEIVDRRRGQRDRRLATGKTPLQSIGTRARQFGILSTEHFGKLRFWRKSTDKS